MSRYERPRGAGLSREGAREGVQEICMVRNSVGKGSKSTTFEGRIVWGIRKRLRASHCYDRR